MQRHTVIVHSVCKARGRLRQVCCRCCRSIRRTAIAHDGLNVLRSAETCFVPRTSSVARPGSVKAGSVVMLADLMETKRQIVIRPNNSAASSAPTEALQRSRPLPMCDREHDFLPTCRPSGVRKGAALRASSTRQLVANQPPACVPYRPTETRQPNVS